MTLLKQMAVSGALLAAFAVVGAALLAGSHAVTEPRIEANVRATLERQLQEVLPTGDFEQAVSASAERLEAPEHLQALGTRKPVTLYRARRDGETVAAVFDVTTPEGYSGDIRLLVGVHRNGTVTGVRAVAHRETPGLGDKIDTAKSDWIKTFSGRSLGDPPAEDWQVARDGGAFDQFSGATITPRSVVRQVARVLSFAQERHERIYDTRGNANAPQTDPT
ncbi:electron transport complex subunit RsxG [Algiphilus aromaticivorans]|jgi:electron transport complex protein RnfG|uniref:electron transport complex subunit RsxG n=1 Tax=Algiphilus aromaticivorans TaxID=382454 RepID=UPI000694316F|nr:electron transport complex subunit RsxG [Algiphilus aromaticivorans]